MAKRRMLRVFGCLLGFLFVGCLLVIAGGILFNLENLPFKLISYCSVSFGLGLLIIVPIYFGHWGKEIDEPIERAIQGAVAEEEIAELLNLLPDDYVIFSDFLCPFGNIDHIVVGPTGVFVIETKSHTGRITLSQDGKLMRNSECLEKDFFKQVLDQTFWLKEKVSDQNSKPFINPVVVFSRAFVKVPYTVKTVRVVNKKYLLRHITQNSKKLPMEDVHRISSVLSQLIKQKEDDSTISGHSHMRNLTIGTTR